MGKKELLKAIEKDPRVLSLSRWEDFGLKGFEIELKENFCFHFEGSEIRTFAVSEGYEADLLLALKEEVFEYRPLRYSKAILDSLKVYVLKGRV